MNTLLIIVTSLLLDTASTQAYLQGQYGQSSMPISGTEEGGFSVHAESVYDINTVSRVFGEASYSWAQSRGNQWVENADWQMLYPYLTCDTVGGGMRSERYWFRGGYRMAKKHVIWHLALQYRALQSYRSIDPRPKNKVAELNVEGSVGYIDNHYAYSLMAQVGRYKQNNDIAFYSELGNAMIYHLVQPADDYTRFAGDFTSSYYHGIGAGAMFMLQPCSSGWLATLGYNYRSVVKELNSSTSTPIAQLRIHTVDAEIGYADKDWHVIMQADYNLRQGTQYIYGDVTGNYYHLLTTSDNYREQTVSCSLQGNYRIFLPIGYLSLMAEVGYLHKFANVGANREARFAELASYLMAAQLNTNLSVRYAFPMKGRFSWFVEPMATYNHYFANTATSVLGWQVTLKTGILF